MVYARVPDARRCRGCSGRRPVGVAAAAAGSRCRSRCRSCGPCATRTDGPSLNGALARTGHAPARVLRAALGGAAWRADDAAARASAPVAAARCARRCARPGASCASASCCACGSISADGDFGEGEAAPLEPYDGVSLARGARRRSTPTARCWRGAGPRSTHADAARRVRGRARRCRRRWPRSTSRCGTAPAAGRGCPVAQLIAAGAVRVGRRQRDDRAPTDRAGAAAQAAAAARAGFRCVKVKVGIGDDAGRVAAVRAAVGPDDGDPGRRQRRLGDARGGARATCARWRRPGSSCAEEPVHGVEALRAVRADVAGADRDGRDGRRARRRRLRRGRRGLPEDRALRRDLRRAARRPRGARGRHRGLRRLDLRRPARASRPALHAAAALRASGLARRLRPRDAGRCSRASTRCSAAARGAIAVPDRPRPPADGDVRTILSASGHDARTATVKRPLSASDARRPMTGRLQVDRRGRRPGPTCRRASGQRGAPSARRSRGTSRRARRRPASTGIASSRQAVPQRRHDAGAEAAQRGGEARGRCCAGGRRRRLGDAARAGPRTAAGRPTRARRPRSPIVSIRAASASSAARRAARSAGSASPGLAPTSTSRVDARGPGESAACSAIRPPIE